MKGLYLFMMLTVFARLDVVRDEFRLSDEKSKIEMQHTEQAIHEKNQTHENARAIENQHDKDSYQVSAEAFMIADEKEEVPVEPRWTCCVCVVETVEDRAAGDLKKRTMNVGFWLYTAQCRSQPADFKEGTKCRKAYVSANACKLHAPERAPTESGMKSAKKWEPGVGKTPEGEYFQTTDGEAFYWIYVTLLVILGFVTFGYCVKVYQVVEAKDPKDPKDAAKEEWKEHTHMLRRNSEYAQQQSDAPEMNVSYECQQGTVV